MDALDLLFTRRSIRSFAPGEITMHQIETILRAAMAAPSSANRQPWHFIVIRERALLDAIPAHHPHAACVTQTALAILVCIDTREELAPGYGIQDASAATMNILYAAHAQGLGAVWCGCYPREQRIAAFRELFGLPTEILPVSLVVIGPPGEQKGPSERFKAERIHFDRW